MVSKGEEGEEYVTNIVGIVSKTRTLYPALMIARYPAFLGGKVEAVNLNCQD
jgi:hypothetical protein